MKICHVTNASGWSGGLAQMQFLLEQLQHLGHENILVCPPDCELLPKVSALKNLQIVKLKIFQDYDLVSAMRIRHLVKNWRPDIVHAHHAQAHAVTLAALIGLKTPGFVVSRRVSFSPRKNPFSRWKYRSKRIQKYTVVSGAVKDTLIAGGVDHAKIEIVYSAVDPQSFVCQQTPQQMRTSLNIAPDARVIGKVANYAQWKGQHIFLQAAQQVLKKYPQTVFVLAGKRTQDLQAQVASMGLENNVRLLGFRRDVPDVLSTFDISCNAAVEGEGLSGAMRESFWLKLPVVASDVAGNREIVQDGKTGFLVQAGNATAMADKMIYILENLDSARSLAQNGRQWVMENATVSVMGQRFEQVYKNVLAQM